LAVTPSTFEPGVKPVLVHGPLVLCRPLPISLPRSPSILAFTRVVVDLDCDEPEKTLACPPWPRRTCAGPEHIERGNYSCSKVFTTVITRWQRRSGHPKRVMKPKLLLASACLRGHVTLPGVLMLVLGVACLLSICAPQSFLFRYHGTHAPKQAWTRNSTAPL
jgi:hypothetical protein